jgi:hypothetical protein
MLIYKSQPGLPMISDEQLLIYPSASLVANRLLYAAGQSLVTDLRINTLPDLKNYYQLTKLHPHHCPLNERVKHKV